MSLGSMVLGLEAAGIRFVVIGGFAGIAHGLTHVTEDLDICYDSAEDNLEALASLLASWDAYPRGAPPGLPWFMDVRALKTSPILTLQTREGDIDVFDRVEGVGDYDACVAASSWLPFHPIRFRILNLDALISAKKAAGRPKDIEHIKMLDALRKMKRNRPE